MTLGPDETLGDSDGDGVDDATDNCPNDENPEQDDVCSETTIRPGGACRATLFIARPNELSRPLLIVAFSNGPIDTLDADRPSCEEGTPMELNPPAGWRVVAVDADVVYILADESASDEPTGLDIPGAELDASRPPQFVEMPTDDIIAVIDESLAGPAASDVAQAVTAEAEATLPGETWRRIVDRNPSLGQAVVGTDQVVIGD